MLNEEIVRRSRWGRTSKTKSRLNELVDSCYPVWGCGWLSGKEPWLPMLAESWPLIWSVHTEARLWKPRALQSYCAHCSMSCSRKKAKTDHGEGGVYFRSSWELQMLIGTRKQRAPPHSHSILSISERTPQQFLLASGLWFCGHPLPQWPGHSVTERWKD